MNTKFDINAIPLYLRGAGWHVWDGKTKSPRIPSPSAPKAKPNQTRPFMECVNFAKSRKWGIGLQMASTTNIVGIDLDGCMGEDWADEIIDKADSLTYVSASGNGIRIIVGGRWRYNTGREWTHPDGQSHHGFGVYPSGITRFLTVGIPYGMNTFATNQVFVDWLAGKYFLGRPKAQSGAIEDIKKIAAYYALCFPDNLLVPHMEASKDQWGKLWRGDWGNYASQSEADLALATHLCFEYVGPDPERLETLISVSGLSRDKWFDREDYRDRTIERAIRGYLDSPVFVSDIVRARR